MRRNELGRPISTGITAPGKRTRFRRERSGRVLESSVVISSSRSRWPLPPPIPTPTPDHCMMPMGVKRYIDFSYQNAENGRGLSEGPRAFLVGPFGELLEEVARLGVVRRALGRHDLDAHELVA